MIAWMLYTVALALLVTGAAQLCAWAAGLHGAPGRWSWMAALICSVGAPIAARQLPLPERADALRTRAATYLAIAAVGGLDVAPAGSVGTASARTPDDIAAIVWAIVSGLAVLAVIGGYVQLHTRRRSWRRSTVCGERVLLSPETGPAVVGVLRSEIVLPEWALTLDPTELTLALRHEREHILARDPWLLLSALLAVAAMPWNPVLWFQLRQLRRAIERDCDARVLTRTRDLRHYVSVLLTVGQRRGTIGSPALALLHTTSLLEWRIRTMTSPAPSHRRSRTLVSAALAVILAAAAVVLPRPGISQTYRTRGTVVSRPRAIARDTGSSATRDSVLSAATVAAKRDTLERLRQELARNPSSNRFGYTVSIKKNTSRASILPSPPIPEARMQAAIANSFPGSVVTTASPTTFWFVVRPDGVIVASDSTSATESPRRAAVQVPADSIASVSVRKHVPVGTGAATVVWIVRK